MLLFNCSQMRFLSIINCISTLRFRQSAPPPPPPRQYPIVPFHPEGVISPLPTQTPTCSLPHAGLNDSILEHKLAAAPGRLRAILATLIGYVCNTSCLKCLKLYLWHTFISCLNCYFRSSMLRLVSRQHRLKRWGIVYDVEPGLEDFLIYLHNKPIF